LRLSIGKPVADTAHRQNVTGTGWVRFDFLPQLPDVNVHHALDHDSFA
jgi:hypothetical protein